MPSADNLLYGGSLESPFPFSMSRMTIRGGEVETFYYLGTGLLPSPAPTRTLHQHAYYEIVFVLEGELMQHLENGVFRYRAGDACFLNRNVHHREGYESDCSLVFVNIRQPFFQALYTENPVRPGQMQAARGPVAQFIEENEKAAGLEREYLDFAAASARPEGGAKTAEAILGQLEAEMTGQTAGYAFRVQGLLLQLFEELENPAHYHISRIRIDSSPDEFICTRVVRYLEACHGRASRAQLGELLHYNGDYLNRIVKRHTGSTIAQLGQAICMREAKKRLAESGESISSILASLGIVNRTYFYQMFTREVGLSPGEYRRYMQRENGAEKP